MQNRRRGILVHPKTQLKLAGIGVGLLILSHIVIFVWITQEHLHPLQEGFRSIPREALLKFILFLFFESCFVFLGILYLTYRILGPVFRVGRALNRWSRGEVEYPIQLRQKDAFLELARAYNVAAEEQNRIRQWSRDALKELELMRSDLAPRHQYRLDEIKLRYPKASQK